MTHYEERLERDVADINAQIIHQADSVVGAMNNAIRALLDGDEQLASEVVLADGPINRSMRHIDAMCHRFIAVHLPSGKHLRLISSIIRINITLERIGDYAVTIARELMQLNGKPTGAVAQKVEEMFQQSMQILSQAMDAYKSEDDALAKETMTLTKKTIAQFNDVLPTLVHEQDKRAVTDLFALFVVFHHMVRVSDQAKNICEDTVFAVTGETKAKKIYRVLFVDEDNSCLGQIAEAIGNKMHAYGGTFDSAGRSAASALHSGLAEFLSKHGVDVDACAPKSLSDFADKLDDYHVIVSLAGKARSYIDQVPFHTTLLDWDLGDVLPDDAGDLCDQHLDDAYRDLAVKIQDLMLLLRGKEPTKE